MKSFEQVHDEEDKKKFQRRNLLARMAGNIAAGSAIDVYNEIITQEDMADAINEIAVIAVDIAKRILDEIDKEEG